jgi:hypothetical protein
LAHRAGRLAALREATSCRHAFVSLLAPLTPGIVKEKQTAQQTDEAKEKEKKITKKGPSISTYLQIQTKTGNPARYAGIPSATTWRDRWLNIDETAKLDSSPLVLALCTPQTLKQQAGASPVIIGLKSPVNGP